MNRRNTLLCSLAILILLPGAGRAALRQEIRIPQNGPRVAYTARELEAWKKDESRRQSLEQAIARGDSLLRKPLTVPNREGDWVFYYVCETCNVEPKPESPGNLDVHICPKCKARLTDAKVVGGYISKLHNILNQQCFDLALAYALTGDRKYADPVREALLKLAQIYPTLERHDRWGRRGILAVVGGRRYCQHLSEGLGCITLSKAYDLIADTLSPEHDRIIREDFLGKTAREILKYNRLGVVGGRNNHQTWFNATYVITGLAIGDPALVETGLYGGAGLLWQLENSITDDGIWYEGTMDYHRYAQQAMIETLDAAARMGIFLKDNARLKSLWTGPLHLAYPDGTIPAFNDSNPGSLAGFASVFRWGADYFGDPLLRHRDTPPDLGGKSEILQPPGTVLSSAGIAVLRRGKPGNPLCAMLDFGLHGGAHGHPDKLNLVFYALGRQFLLDPGRIRYGIPEFETWCRKTVAHNTVLINQQDQKPTEGRMIFFTNAIDHTACLAFTDEAYPGYSLSRFLLLTDEILVDLYQVKGKKPATLDWIVHSAGTLSTPRPPAPVQTPPGDKNGYQHLTETQELKSPEGTAVFDFKTESGAFMRMTTLDAPDVRYFTGMGIGTTLKNRIPFVLRRKESANHVFITIYDLTGNGKAVSAVRLLPVEGQSDRSDAVAIAIRDSEDKEWITAVHFSSDKTIELHCAGKPFTHYMKGVRQDRPAKSIQTPPAGNDPDGY